MTRNNDLIRYATAMVAVITTLLFWSCDNDDDWAIEIPLSTDLVTYFYLPSSMPVYHGEHAAINGKGFQAGDVLVFSSPEGEVEIPVSFVGSNYARFYIPDDFSEGDYSLQVKRSDQAQYLGTFHVRIVLNVFVPDKAGMTVKGVVYSGTEPLEGVRVSDGVFTTTTDADGFYWLPSEKYHGYVFITTPSGYQPVGGTNAAPGFWSTLAESGSTVERHDFDLKQVDNNKHIVLAAADTHLANRGSSNNDMTQFNDGFMTEAKQFVASQTVPLYAFVLGDMSWELYWYSRSYDIGDYKETVSSFNAPMYHVLGNHDNDPYINDDFLSEAKYKKAFGPSYYSMDVGEVHYVFLDNVIYINNGGQQGFVGDRSYAIHLTDIQLNWLKEDLDAVADKTRPVIVSFHCPSTSNYNATFSLQKRFTPASKTDEFHQCFSAFDNVHFLNGHTHVNANMQVTPSIREHNIASVCETWWWAGKLTDQNVCKDGSPSGYKIFEVDGRDIKWYYKGIGQDRNKQFRTYDVNEVQAFYNQPAVIDVISMIQGRSNDFAFLPANSVLLNVWDYDPSWTISVTENGAALAPERTFMRDPLHVLCYDYTRILTSGGYTSSFVSTPNSHMFVVPTGSANGTLEITVTDGFGRVYKETMTRPKSFRKSME